MRKLFIWRRKFLSSVFCHSVLGHSEACMSCSAHALSSFRQRCHINSRGAYGTCTVCLPLHSTPPTVCVQLGLSGADSGMGDLEGEGGGGWRRIHDEFTRIPSHANTHTCSVSELSQDQSLSCVLPSHAGTSAALLSVRPPPFFHLALSVIKQ